MPWWFWNIVDIAVAIGENPVLWRPWLADNLVWEVNMFEGIIIMGSRLKKRSVMFRYPKWSDLPDFTRMRQTFHREQIMAGNEAVDQELAARRLADILVRMETNRARWLFVFIDGQLSGQGQVDVTGKLYATIGLALLKQGRGVGLGRRMMELLEPEALALKRRRLFLTVWSANTVAFELYKRLGYREIGRRPDWQVMPNDPRRYSDLVEMVKKI